MSQKRQPEEGRNSPSDKRRRRLTTLKHVILEVMKKQRVQKFLEQILEPLVRKVVKEEIEVALGKHFTTTRRSCGKESHPSKSRSLQLQFVNDLSLPVFTGAQLESDQCSKIKVALVDGFSRQLIDSGPESSANVEIVVLEGDFDGDEGCNWTVEEFEKNIVREREGKGPLLTGDGVVKLKDGIGLVHDIAFSDNSSWTRSRSFRLGARVMDDFEGIRIREAKTKSFVVKDHRGESYKKHHPPLLFDDVWRLEKIGKDGAFHQRLKMENINTVKDFLTLLYRDPSRLRKILGPGMSSKMWEVMIEHAQTCPLGKKMYLYRPPSSQWQTGVVCNVVGQLKGLLSNGEYVRLEKLSETEKADARSILASASQHWEEVVPFENEDSLTSGLLNIDSVTCSPGSPGTSSYGSLRFLASNKNSGSDNLQLHTSSPDVMSPIFTIDDYSFDSVDNMGLGYSQSSSDRITNTRTHQSGSPTPGFSDDDHLQYFVTECSQSQRPNAIDNAQRRWRKLFSVFKWVLKKKNRDQ